MKQIENYPDYSVTENGDVWSEKTKRFLSPCTSGPGYPYVVLSKNRERKNQYIHRLVARAYIPNPTGLLVVNHRNGIKTDNRVENLEWVSYSENNKHAYDTGLKSCSESTRLLIGEASSKPVLCVETGQVFSSIIEASRSQGLCDKAVHSALFRGGRCGGFHWAYV